MESQDTTRGKAEERILAAAISLFASRGFNGVSTRDIAVAANVNEVTIYRRYPRKRDLYLAAVGAELERVHLGGAKLREIAEAPDARQALLHVFRLIETTLAERPEMLRLLLYGSLENAADVDILVRKHLGEFVEILTGYIGPWATKGETLGQSGHALVLGLAAVAVFYRSLDKLFPSGLVGHAAIETLADYCLQ